jgi:hypothetical protein
MGGLIGLGFTLIVSNSLCGSLMKMIRNGFQSEGIDSAKYIGAVLDYTMRKNICLSKRKGNAHSFEYCGNNGFL